jgi:hypothetical protein
MTAHRTALISAAILGLLAAPPPPAAAQTTRGGGSRSLPIRERFLVVNVRTNAGDGVPGAVALVSEVDVVPADPQGIIRIELKPPLRLPLMIDIQAPGYRPRQIMIEGFERGAVDVYLEAEGGAPARRGDQTVSAGELSPEKRQAAQKLEDAATRALEAGDNAKAEGLLRSALEISPHSSAVCTNLGIAILRQGRLDDAVVFLEKAHQIAPYVASTAGNLALIRWMQHRYDDCYLLVDRAVALGFPSQLARYCLGVLALGRGYLKQSALELGKVDSKRFQYRDLFLSIALRGLGQSKAADRAFQEFMGRQSLAMLVSTAHRRPHAFGDGGDGDRLAKNEP